MALRARWADMPMIPRVVHDRSEGVDNSWGGFDVRTILIGEESGGRFTFHDVIVAPGAELPPHHLSGSDTHISMLAGELELTIGALTDVVGQDGFAYAPADTTQAIRNRSAEPVRFFMWHSPAGPERAFAAAHRVFAEDPDADADAFQLALSSLGYHFHRGGEHLPNDDRTNAAAERLEVDVQTFEDYTGLREAWSRRPPVPKLVPDRTTVAVTWIPGQDTNMLLSGDEGSGRSVILQHNIVPGYLAADHHQPSEEEIFMVVEGTLDLTAGNATTELQRGGFGFVPRYGTHRFSNPMQQGLTRIVSVNSPAGHERGFETMSKEQDLEKLLKLLVAHGWSPHEGVVLDDYVTADQSGAQQ
jgi:mannose-6-phosphate isomerase-like protein (cupin superfamily)